MRTPSIYLSSYFINDIWPAFTADFRNNDTKNTYFSDICTFADYIQKDILEASYSDCKMYFHYLQYEAKSTRNASNNTNGSDIKPNLKTSTIAKKYKELNTLFSFICDNNYSVPLGFENHFIKIQISLPKDILVTNRILSTTTLDILLEYFKGKSSAMYVAIILAFKQLLRTSELVRIRVNDMSITDTGTYLLIFHPNGSDKRYVVVTNDVLPVLLTHINTLTGPYLISKDGEKPYSIRTIQKYLSDACKELGIEQVTFNDLRNSAAVNASSNGAPSNMIKTQLGLKSERHLKRYIDTTITQCNASDYINIMIKK